MDALLMLYVGAFGLILIGIGGIVLCHHLVRIIFAIGLLEAGVNLLLILAGYRADAVAPIILGAEAPASMVDPIPQALVLTAIVIGVGILALALSLALRVQKAYGTLDIREVRQHLETEIATETGIDLPASSDAPQPAGGLSGQEGNA